MAFTKYQLKCQICWRKSVKLPDGEPNGRMEARTSPFHSTTVWRRAYKTVFLAYKSESNHNVLVFGGIGKCVISWVCMPNVSSLCPTVRNLYNMLSWKRTDKQTDKKNTIYPNLSLTGWWLFFTIDQPREQSFFHRSTSAVYRPTDGQHFGRANYMTTSRQW